MRVSEIYEAYASFRSFVSAGLGGIRGPDIDLDDGKPDGTVDDFVDTFRDRVEVDRDVTIAGHSFGGGTLFSLLQSRPPGGFSRIPLCQAIALDPWVDPLPMPAPPTAAKEDKPDVPLLVINSEGFTLWKTHFRRVLGVVKDAGGSFVTIVGCDRELWRRARYTRTSLNLERQTNHFPIFRCLSMPPLRCRSWQRSTSWPLPFCTAPSAKLVQL